jgi:malate dehydrogenase
MSLIAIVGAGAIGGATAQKLAMRSRVGEIRLIDPTGTIARGKALDILQSAPVENFGTLVTGTDSLHAAAGAEVIVIADSAGPEGEHKDDAALSLVMRLTTAGVSAPLVFAGGGQRSAMKRTITELRVPSSGVVGSAPVALESALRAICAAVADRSGVDVSLAVVGVPPKHAAIAWEEATISGQPLAAVIPAHEIAAVSARLPGLWPPGPYALGSAATRIVEALCDGSRRRYSCFVDAGRGRVAAMPVELGPGGIRRIIEPALTRLERTTLENAFEV